VLHDWADEYCLTILKHLRVAAGPKTQLVIVEMMISSVCDEPAAREIPGAELPVPPYPLLRNVGCAAQTPYRTDLMVRGQKQNSNHDDDVTDPTFLSLLFYLTC
jgi:O-methyltransferase domain